MLNKLWKNTVAVIIWFLIRPNQTYSFSECCIHILHISPFLQVSIVKKKYSFDQENCGRASVIRMSKLFAQVVHIGDYQSLFLARIFPFRSPLMCVCVCKKSNRDIGVIRLIRGLNTKDNLKCDWCFEFFLWINLLGTFISQICFGMCTL